MRHNHKYHYITSPNELQYVFGNLTFFLSYEQKYFVNFVHFGYCNLRKSVLYCNHNRGGTVQWQSKQPTLITKDQRNTRGSDPRRKNDASKRSQTRAMKANVLSDGSQVTRHSPFTKTPQEAIETNTSQLENRKQINRISRIHRGSVRGRL